MLPARVVLWGIRMYTMEGERLGSETAFVSGEQEHGVEACASIGCAVWVFGRR